MHNLAIFSPLSKTDPQNIFELYWNINNLHAPHQEQYGTIQPFQAMVFLQHFLSTPAPLPQTLTITL
jgi:hypothetical protein